MSRRNRHSPSIRSLTCSFTSENVRARGAEDEAGADTGHREKDTKDTEAPQGGGGSGTQEMEETGGPGKTGDSSCSLVSHPLDPVSSHRYTSSFLLWESLQ